MTKKKSKKISKQESLAYTDDLTGLYNRRYLKKKQKETRRLIVNKIPFSVAVVDIDRFKEINDTYGHQKGDSIIKGFAHFLRDILRKTDVVIRYGGDEFVCIMPHTRRRTAEQIYWRVLDKVKKKKFAGVDLTISAGISSFPEDGRNFSRLLEVADQALYEAKRGGRARIGLAGKKRLEIPTKVFIGRRREKEILRALLNKKDCTLQVAVIKGTVGIGKTRLAKELLNDLRGKEILWSDCISLHDEMSYYPIRELIKYRTQRQGDIIFSGMPMAYRIEIGKLVPELMVKDIEDVQQIGLVVDRYRLYESIRTFLEKGKQPRVIIIDNMQWVDKETTEVLKYLLRSLNQISIIFLFIFRSEEMNPVLSEFTSYISRETTVKSIDLKPFEQSDTKEMLRSIIGDDPEDKLSEYILHNSGGNPFYIEEIIKLLHEYQYLNLIKDKWIFNEPDDEIIPGSIEDITERKYRSLDIEEKEVLNIASAVGNFNVDVIKELLAYNEGHVLGILENIMKIGFIKVHGDKFEFREAVSRDAIYKTKVMGLKARLLHKKIADYIEQQNADKKEDVIEELAFQYYHGADKDKGVKYSLMAGNKAKEIYANRSALLYFTWAEELLRDEEGIEKIQMRIDCLIEQADVYALIGNIDNALKNMEICLELAGRINDRTREADILYKKSVFLFRIAQFKKAMDISLAALSIYEELDYFKGVSDVKNAIGNIYVRQGDFEKGLECYHDSLGIIKSSGDKEREGRLLNNLGIVYINTGDYYKALDYFNEALAIFEVLGNKALIANMLSNIGVIYRDLAHYDKALNIHKKSLEISSETGNKIIESHAFNNRGILYTDLLDYESALKDYEQALEINRNIGDPSLDGALFHNIGLAYYGLGFYDKAKEYFTKSLPLFLATGNKQGEAEVSQNLGLVNMHFGNIEKALQYMEKCLNICQQLGDRSGQATIIAYLCDLYHMQGDTDKAIVMGEKALKISEKLQVGEKEVFSLLSMGRVFMTLDNDQKAEHFIEKARQKADKLGILKVDQLVLPVLCAFYLKIEDMEKFRISIEKLQKIAKKSGLKQMNALIGFLYGQYHLKLKDCKVTRNRLNEALIVYKEMKDMVKIGEIYYYLGRAASLEKKKDIAEKHLKEAYRIFKKIKAKIWQTKVEELINNLS